MIPLRICITEYNPLSNNCRAQLQDDNFICLDPFVSCAINMTDEEYAAGEGHNLVGKTYLMTSYTVYKHEVVPHEDGMIEL